MEEDCGLNSVDTGIYESSKLLELDSEWKGTRSSIYRRTSSIKHPNLSIFLIIKIIS